ncbi:MAG: glycerol-3-phosphate 1-O-acyltransferase PlsY [Synergistaceae bacterium]|nr:glycerol-3-phosphate 1-O-acyltransferase PlsY [Synergistaceae bacterium]
MREIMLCVIVSYLIGSFPTGYIVTRVVKGMDIRDAGSRGTGATNVRRVMGHGWGVFVAVIDMLKGALAVLVTGAAGMSALTASWLLSLAGLAAVIGHNYPVWLKFKGGKGVSTTFGAMFFLYPYESFAITLLSGAIWYAVMTSTRYVSLASMTSLLSMPLFFWMLDAPFPFIMVSFVLAVFSICRHGSNIDRLAKGTENRA